MSAQDAAKNMFSVTGFVVEIGNIHLGNKSGDPKTIGVTLECGDRYVQVGGLDRDEARRLATLMRQEGTRRSAPVTKP